jgi:hypothetical protein
LVTEHGGWCYGGAGRGYDERTLTFEIYPRRRILSALSTDPELSPDLMRYRGFETEWAIYAVRDSFNKMPGPPQLIEFLAKTLMTAPGIILGTPLYVALAE